MKASFKKTVLGVAVAAAISMSASASAYDWTPPPPYAPPPPSSSVYDFSFKGMFTLQSNDGASTVSNTSLPHYYNQWDGYRTNISGTMHFDTTTGAGTATLVPFDFLNGFTPAEAFSMQLQAIGNGAGGPGSLVLGNMLFDWNYNTGIPVSIVWDMQGLLGALQNSGGAFTNGQVIDGTYGVTGATNGMMNGIYSMGTLAMATTGWNTTTCAGAGMGSAVSGCLPLIANTIGGSPIPAGPFLGLNANFDLTSMTVVPVPAAAWLLGSGLLGLIGVVRRKSA